MLATWPMVFGALVAGLIAGFLIPDIHQKPAPSSVVAAKTSVKAPETKKTVETKTPAPAPTKDTSAPAPKTAAAEDCERQTWPYLTPNCLDRSAQAAAPDVVVKTKLSEPKSEVESEPAQTPAAPAAPTTTASTPTAPASIALKTDGVPKADRGRETGSAATEPAPAPKTDTPAAPKSATVNPAPNELKQESAQAAAPAAEKTARRPVPRARAGTRAEVQDEPLRARVERYRSERRYAGQYDDDGPVYIERGGRLYLAPEYQHRLRGPDRYWREW